MSAESDERPTLASLAREADLRWKSHDGLHEAHAKAHDREHSMTTDAIGKAEAALDRRLEGMNEFRDQLRDQAATFIRREAFDALDQRLDNMEKWRTGVEGRIIGIGAAIGILVIIVNIALRFL